ncbi:DUF1697 domain-containing protein [Luteimonas gilva]|uniref:DUF1697 domain-containing protein n=1 Tax=Luteimonas gilva TaxID=2572684 RepID=A0A4U5JXI6_9GAMM|nr:DUF1697 domain-containing protein [Luteimonas gilva]TKR33896.1 DUF1697 domain-containing protein [Luteimonas gilva]
MATTTYVGLLRAVNVGGTGKLPMADLREMCEAAGFRDVRTYIASGNVVFRSKGSADKAKSALEKALAEYAGKPVGVAIRTHEELAAVAAGNPFQDAAGNRLVVVFLDAPPPADALKHASHQTDERIALGRREIYIAYGEGMGDSKLKLPAAKTGTGRNLNTVMKLIGMSAE